MLDIKNSITITCFFVMALICNAQIHNPCEESRVGQLITKPLLRNGVIHHELAIKNLKKAEYKDGVFISKIDSVHQDYLYRIHHINKDSAVMLEYTYNEKYNTCYYFFSTGGKEKEFSFSTQLNADGKIYEANATNDADIEEYQQSQVDTLLKYFK